MTRPSRLRRSELSTPATSEKMMTKAAHSDADLVFLDLEDSVAPSAKEAARRGAVEALTALDWGAKTRAVRVNGLDSEWCLDDVISVVSGGGAALDVLILPKVKGPDEVLFIDRLLGQLEMKFRLPAGRIGLEVLIEEAEALRSVDAIASCCPRVEALILGVGDLSASLGMRLGHIGETVEGHPEDIWHYARTRMVVAARANGLDAIDGPSGNLRDLNGYRREATRMATLGGVGKWCIHPSQITVANEVFSPTAAEIETALEIVEAVEKAEAAGEGAAQFGGIMVDAATARIFHTVLDRARRTGQLEESVVT